MAETLLARAEYDTDWHLYITDPEQGELGYCTGVGPDEDFDPEAADRTLEDGGWQVTGAWTATPEDLPQSDPLFFAAWAAPVVRAGG